MTFAFPTTTTEDCLQKSIGYIIAIIKDRPKTLHLLYYGDATKNVINNIAQILHRSTSQPRLQILPLPPLLTQTQSENIKLQNIPSIPVPAPRVESILQPPRVKIFKSAPTRPPILHHYTSPSLDI